MRISRLPVLSRPKQSVLYLSLFFIFFLKFETALGVANTDGMGLIYIPNPRRRSIKSSLNKVFLWRRMNELPMVLSGGFYIHLSL